MCNLNDTSTLLVLTRAEAGEASFFFIYKMKDMEGYIEVSSLFSNASIFKENFMNIKLQQHIKHHKRLHVDFCGSKAPVFSETIHVLTQ